MADIEKVIEKLRSLGAIKITIEGDRVTAEFTSTASNIRVVDVTDKSFYPPKFVPLDTYYGEVHDG